MDASRPLLTRLRAENVRSFATLDLELGPLTVLVGPNGAGKSNVVAALRFLRDGVRAGVEAAIIQQRGWSFFCRRDAESVTIEPSFRLFIGGLKIEDIPIGWTLKNDNYAWWDQVRDKVARHNTSFRNEIYGANMDSDVGIADKMDIEVREIVRPILSNISIYQIEPFEIRDLAQRMDKNSALREDMSNLGAVLLAIRETPLADEMDRALALLIEGVTGYAVAQAGSTLVPQILYGPGDARDLGLESDGTIRLVALLTALYQPVPPSLIVLEEPEMGLHPGVLGALAEIIDEATLRMQVLITTHSPDLIDRFDPDVLRIVEKVNGESVVGRVDPAQRDLIHKRLYRPSELMRIEGLVREPG